MYTPEESRTVEQRDGLALSEMLIGELAAADDYVFGLPMHNFTVPSVLLREPNGSNRQTQGRYLSDILSIRTMSYPSPTAGAKDCHE